MTAKHVAIVAINVLALAGYSFQYSLLTRRILAMLPPNSLQRGPPMTRLVAGVCAALLMAIWIASSLAW